MRFKTSCYNCGVYMQTGGVLYYIWLFNIATNQSNCPKAKINGLCPFNQLEAYTKWAIQGCKFVIEQEINY